MERDDFEQVSDATTVIGANDIKAAADSIRVAADEGIAADATVKTAADEAAAVTTEAKPDLTATQALEEVDKLETELNEIKEARKKGGKYADSYASSESNIADMLAEYDMIGNDDRPLRRRPASTKRAASDDRPRAKRPASEVDRVKKADASRHVRKAESERPVKKAAASKAAKDAIKSKPVKAASPAKTSAPKKHKYADAMYDDAPVMKAEKSRPHTAEHSDKAKSAVKTAPVDKAAHHKTASTAHKKADAHRASDARKKPASRDTARTNAPRKSADVRHGSATRHTGRKGKKPGFSERMGTWFHNLTGLDYLVAVTGVAVLIVAIVVVNIFGNAKAVDSKVAEFAAIGSNLEGVGAVGEGVLYATANSRDVSEPESEEEVPEIPEYNEKEDEESGSVTVGMNLQSVVKDLKIKFINKKSSKLIAGIPFQAEVTDANGKKQTYTDDDKDGVIYIAKMQHGDTVVKLIALDGYNNYKFDTTEQKINVKETLEYKKIDVADEIKKESQVNAAVEDTAQEIQVEGALTDTVEWVESTKTPIGTETKYIQVKASEIAKPASVSGIRRVDSLYYRVLQMTEHTWVSKAFAENDPTTAADPTQDPTPDPNATTDPTQEATQEVTPTPTDTPTPTPTDTPTPTPTDTPTPTPTDTPTPTPTPTPTATTAVNRDSKLKTTGGAQLYVKKGDSYREASAGDYLDDPQQPFYRQSTEASSYSYTGWQVIDGSTYFFDKNGNKVTGEQVIQGAKCTFNSEGVLQAGSGSMGIDVSKWNGSIDWTAVRNSGVSYVIIRCGYRGSTTGALIEDPTFRSNIKGATAAGLKVGVYFFTQAVNEVEAVEEASMTLNLISGYKISYPVFLDVEGSKGRGDAIDSATRTAVINAYCKTIANSGYTAGVYANKTWLTERFNPGALGNAKIWLAQYAATPTYAGRYNMWQYTSKGQISGISGYVDMNLSYMGK